MKKKMSVKNPVRSYLVIFVVLCCFAQCANGQEFSSDLKQIFRKDNRGLVSKYKTISSKYRRTKHVLPAVDGFMDSRNAIQPRHNLSDANSSVSSAEYDKQVIFSAVNRSETVRNYSASSAVIEKDNNGLIIESRSSRYRRAKHVLQAVDGFNGSLVATELPKNLSDANSSVASTRYEKPSVFTAVNAVDGFNGSLDATELSKNLSDANSSVASIRSERPSVFTAVNASEAVKNCSGGSAEEGGGNCESSSERRAATSFPYSRSGHKSSKNQDVGLHYGVYHGTRLSEDKSHLPLSPPNGNGKEGKIEYQQCQRPARCEPLNYTSCFGATLFYKHTSLDLVNGTSTQKKMQEQLRAWQSLRNVPKCWAVVQTLLCAVYMPRCDNGRVDLPSFEICRATRGPCRIVESTLKWPSFLRCNAEDNFPIQCKTEARELRFNTSSVCQPPLVATDIVASWYEGWEGCGLDCHNPLFTYAEHAEIHSFVGVVGCMCLFCSLFTVLTFFIDWKSANKYPALIIFYINWCFLISSIGWLAQFTPGARDDIVCRRDGTLRKSEPTSGENLSCVIVFVMVYYFLMAAVIWFVMLAYSWYISFKALGKIREAIEAKTAYFHLMAWSLPLVLTIAILALGQVDGDSVSGICFVGHVSWYMRIGFVLIPISISVMSGGFFLVRGLIVLVKLKIGSDDLISPKASAKIRETIIRLGVFTGVAFLLLIITFACHLYEYSHQEEWNQSLRQYIICKSNLTGTYGMQSCTLKSRPSVAVTQLHLLILFAAGIIMSTWIWTSSTIDSWKRFLRRAFRQPINEPVKLTKHKMIAKAFAKRREMKGSRMSFSFQSTHDDPLGMNFELNSVASQEISSTWQAALPKFIARRGAFMGAGDLGLRRNSSASDFSQRRPSLDSHCARRHSLDSQISFHMSEQERQVYMAQAREQRRRKKKGVKRRGEGTRVVPSMGLSSFQRQRRGSDASQHSDFGHLIPHQLLNARKVNNIEKEAKNATEMQSRPATGFSKPRTALQLQDLLFRRSRHGSGSIKKKLGRANLGFLRASNSSINGSPTAERKSASLTHLPGQIQGENYAGEKPTDRDTAMLKGSFSRKKRDEDAKSTVSTDNESLHKLGEQLSNSILVRAIQDSQSDLEMKPVTPNACLLSRLQLPGTSGNRTKSQIVESSLNNCFPSGRSTIVDMAMDSDNRDSSSC